MSVRESQKVKTLDTLIDDIYGVLDNLNTDEGIEIPEELTEEFLASMKESLESWSTPRLQSKSIRMSNVGRPLRRIWYDMQEEPEGSTDKHVHPSTFVKFLYGHMLEHLAILLVKLSTKRTARCVCLDRGTFLSQTYLLGSIQSKML
jgi:hypothetical protein